MYLNIYSNYQTWETKENSWEREWIVIGADKDDIEIAIENKTLIVKFDGNDYTSAFNHVVNIPDGITTNDISSVYEAGVLTVIVQKPKDFRQRIPIQ